MGCYDTLNFACPACGKNVAEQSKAGPCNLDDYTLSSAPLSIIASINRYSRQGDLWCPHCNTQLDLEVRFFVTPKVRNTNDPCWRVE